MEWQLRVAAGEPLPKSQDELSINGHAVEARLYAEDPGKGFLPSVGKLEHFDLGSEGRIETGVEEGDQISPFYDPMIAKLIGRGSDRAEAIGELASIFDAVEVWPVRTNAAFLFNALLHDDFASATIDTGFIERNLPEIVPDSEPSDAIWRGAAALALIAASDDELLGDLAGFRLNAGPSANVALRRGSTTRLVSSEDGEIAEVSGFLDGDRIVVFTEGQSFEFDLSSRGTGVSHGIHDGEIEAPMPGKVTAVDVSPGDRVAKGERLLTLEAMKMEHALVAPFDGSVTELNAGPGAQVSEGQLLVKLEAEPQA